MNDVCKTETVELQENGIVRNQSGEIIGQLEQISSKKEIIRQLKVRLQCDDSWAWSWHSDIAMTFYEVLYEADIVSKHCINEIYGTCNDAAGRFMEVHFDVDTLSVLERLGHPKPSRTDNLQE